MARAGKILNGGRDAGRADLILDRALVDDLCAVAAGQEFLAAYLSERLDFLNLTAMERCLARGVAPADCSAAFLPGGSIRPECLETLYIKEPAERLNGVREHCATEPPVTAYQAYLEHGKLALLERDRDRAGLAFAAEWTRHTYGPEVLFAYAVVKEIEIQNLRLILTSLTNGISGRAVAERIR